MLFHIDFGGRCLAALNERRLGETALRYKVIPIVRMQCEQHGVLRIIGSVGLNQRVVRWLTAVAPIARVQLTSAA
jgi:hypothetical protein